MRLKKSRDYKKLKKSVKEGEILIIPSDDRLVTDFDPPYVAGPRKLPSWFRSTPKDGIRSCAGIRNFLELGVIVPAWTTFKFIPDAVYDDWSYNFPSLPESRIPFQIESFNYTMTGQCPMSVSREKKESYYPKLVTPFSFITAPGWSVMMFGLLFEPNENYDVIPGIVNTDYYHQVNVALNLKGNKEFTIQHGEPLFQLIPFKRSADFKKIKFASEEYWKYSRFIQGEDIDPLGDRGPKIVPIEYKKMARKSYD